MCFRHFESDCKGDSTLFWKVEQQTCQICLINWTRILHDSIWVPCGSVKNMSTKSRTVFQCGFMSDGYHDLFYAVETKTPLNYLLSRVSPKSNNIHNIYFYTIWISLCLFSVYHSNLYLSSAICIPLCHLWWIIYQIGENTTPCFADFLYKLSNHKKNVQQIVSSVS